MGLISDEGLVFRSPIQVLLNIEVSPKHSFQTICSEEKSFNDLQNV